MDYVNYEFVKPIFDGTIEYLWAQIESFLVEWMIGLVSQHFEPTSTFFFKMLGMAEDITLIEALNNPMFDIFIIIATILSLGVLVYQIICISYGGLSGENAKNSVYELLMRFFVFALPGIIFSRQLLILISDLVQTTMTELGDIDTSAVNDTSLTSQVNALVNGEHFLLLIIIILDIIVAFEFVKLLLEVIERYIVAMFLNIASPIPFGLTVSHATKEITKNFIIMYLSQQFLLIMNRFFLILFCKIVSIPTFKNEIITLLATIAFLKTAQRLDNHLKSMGLSTAQTGGSLFDSVLGAVGALKTMAGISGTALNVAGNAMQVAGAKSGMYGLSNIGSMVSAIAKDGLAFNHTPDKSLKDFASRGGLENVDPNNKDFKKALAYAVANGQYQQFSTAATGAQQTEILKDILSAKDGNGIDIMQKAFGVDASFITEAKMDKYGNITGTINKDGAISAFNLSIKSNGTEGISGFSDNTTRYANINSSGNIPDGFKMDYVYNGSYSNVSTLTGINLDDERLSSIGVTSMELKNGILTGYRNDGGNDTIAFTYDTNTGDCLYAPKEPDYWSKENIDNFQSMFEKDGAFFNDPRYGNGQEPIDFVSNTTDNGGMMFEIKYGNSGKYPDGYSIIFEDVSNSSYEGKYTNLDLGKETGSFNVTKKIEK